MSSDTALPKLLGGTVTGLVAFVTYCVGGVFLGWLLSSQVSEDVALIISFIGASVCACLASLKVWECFVMFAVGYEESVAGYVISGATLLGGTTFSLGFFGPIYWTPSANQGPILGFFTGPAGAALGSVVGYQYGQYKIKTRRL